LEDACLAERAVPSLEDYQNIVDFPGTLGKYFLWHENYFCVGCLLSVYSGDASL
jgi:hypothetical protein